MDINIERMADSIRCFKHNMWTNFFFAATIFKSFSYIVSFLVSLLILQLYYIILVSIFILYYTSFYIVIISE